MEAQPGLATKQDLDYLQTQMKNVYATQAEHADRLMRLEQRQDGESRFRSTWGSQSPFHGPVNGTPQQDTHYNPAAEAFKHFDQDQSTSMMASLHLDTEEEPRRGASRANSVRFDESAKHGHFAQASRSAHDFLPSRTGSAFGVHPLGERSLSHKSDGRQSSTHSARASSIGNDSRPMSAAIPSYAPNALPTGPPPGLFILGPVPSIIRCWLDTNYSNDSLLYAAVCTGSYKSAVSQRLLDRLGFVSQTDANHEGQRMIKLPVYLPEATVQQSSSLSASPAPQLPTLTTEFLVQDIPPDVDAIDVFLGCDVLRFRNADIHFSLDRLTIFDDERNKVTVPLVRPENSALFQDLRTGTLRQTTATALHSPQDQAKSETHETKKPSTLIDGADESKEQSEASEYQQPEEKSSRPPSREPSIVSEGVEKATSDSSNAENGPAAAKARMNGKDIEGLTNGTTADTPSKSESNNIWGSWRREPTQVSRVEATFAGAASASGYQRASRGRGMKVLKPARLNTSRTPSSPQPVGFDAMPPRTGDGTKSATVRKENQSPATSSDRRSYSIESKPPLSSKPSSSNPIGGASAFPWLNSAQKD